MGRDFYQRGWLYKTGKRVKKWKLSFYSWTTLPDGFRKRIHHAPIIGLVSRLSRSEAQEEAARIIARETSCAPALRPDMTLDELFQSVYFPPRRRRWSANTRSALEGTYSRHIAPALGRCTVRSLTKSQVEAFFGSLADSGLGRDLLARVRFLLHGALDEACENEILDKNPVRRALVPKLVKARDCRTLSEQEVRLLFSRLQGRDRLIFRVHLLLGLRPGEVFTLRRNDLTPEGLRIDESWDKTPERVKDTKTHKPRVIPLPAKLRAELLWWTLNATVDAPDALLFPNAFGQVARPQNVRPLLARARKLTGLAGLSWRILRRTTATLYQGDPKDVQALLGHSDLEVTMEHYKQPINERLRASLEALEARLSGDGNVNPAENTTS